jgi:hypothetical protein
MPSASAHKVTCLETYWSILHAAMTLCRATRDVDTHTLGNSVYRGELVKVRATKGLPPLRGHYGG